MIERHYDDEALIALMGDHADAQDAHVPGCRDCSERIESFGLIASMLAGAETWDTRELSAEPRARTIETLRALASRMEDENESAIAFVERLLAGPRELWMSALNRHPEWRTAGVARRLLELAYDAVVTMPPDAVEMTALATEIADHLDAPDGSAAQLRGAAWRDRAYALYYTSRYDEALAACDRADAAFAGCAVAEWDQARVGIVRSLVLRAFERFDEAEKSATEAGRTFDTFEDVDRIASARLVETNVLITTGRYEAAYEILQSLESRVRETSFAETHGRVLGNLGHCAAKLGKYDQALNSLDAAAGIFEMLSIKTESLRARWSIAEILTMAGRFDAAEKRLEAVMFEMADLGLVAESATNALTLAEILLVGQRYDRVEDICRKAIQAFERSGLGYSTRALTALSYMQEAARNHTVKVELLRSVKQYISSLPAQPQLLFAPPPGDR